MEIPAALRTEICRQLCAATLALLTTFALAASLALTLGKASVSELEEASPKRWPEEAMPQQTQSKPSASTQAPGQRPQGLSLSTLETSKVELQLNVAGVNADSLDPPRLGQGLGQLPGDGLGALELGRHSGAVLGLNELDRPPHVMYRPRYRVPKALRDAGMPDTTVQVHVMIHEDGRLTPITYEDLPYPELKPAVERIISKMRYTSPEKDGRRVKAEFLLPLHLEGS